MRKTTQPSITQPTQPTQPLRPTIGWREWVTLPDLANARIKAKVDTGARSSSLHASAIEPFEIEGVPFVRFRLHSSHSNPQAFTSVESKILDVRTIRSSSGETTERPVISTHINLLGKSWPVELTLADRQEMGFRMLLGREAFRGKFLVDAGSSYYNGKPDRKKMPPA